MCACISANQFRLYIVMSRLVYVGELIRLTPHVCKASESGSSGRASCWCHCGPSWCDSPECCSGSSDSPDRRPCQKRFCHCTCRPCSACLCSRQSRWIDGRIAREHISLSARNLRQIKKSGHGILIIVYFETTDHNIFPCQLRGCASLSTMSDHYLGMNFIIIKAWHLSDCSSVTSQKSISLCLTPVCSEDLFFE